MGKTVTTYLIDGEPKEPEKLPEKLPENHEKVTVKNLKGVCKGECKLKIGECNVGKGV